MASTVLSGASNPSYRNNTDQNVRIVINYMQGTSDNTLTISWAGVSANSSSANGPIVIGRNLAHSTYYRESATGGTQTLFGTALGGREGQQRVSVPIGTIPLGAALALSVPANNATGDCALPTELMLAPGQTFSAVCRVYNIVVIPENG